MVVAGGKGERILHFSSQAEAWGMTGNWGSIDQQWEEFVDCSR